METLTEILIGLLVAAATAATLFYSWGRICIWRDFKDTEKMDIH